MKTFYPKQLSLAILNLVNMCSSEVDHQIYYIIPSQNGYCPVKFCPTLSWLAAHSCSNGHCRKLNTTLVFLAGNHSLDSKFLGMNVIKLSMSSSPFKSVNIICGVSASFDFTSIVHVF